MHADDFRHRRLLLAKPILPAVARGSRPGGESPPSASSLTWDWIKVKNLDSPAMRRARAGLWQPHRRGGNLPRPARLKKLVERDGILDRVCGIDAVAGGQLSGRHRPPLEAGARSEPRRSP